MSEIKTIVNVYEINLQCNCCKDGVFVVREGAASNTKQCSPTAHYPHKCNKCRHEMMIKGKNYPQIVYEKVIV